MIAWGVGGVVVGHGSGCLKGDGSAWELSGGDGSNTVSTECSVYSVK